MRKPGKPKPTKTHPPTPSRAPSAPEVPPAQVQYDITTAIILLAEDHEEDVILIRRSFAKANFLNPLNVVSNGEEAIAYLKGEGQYADRRQFPMPDLLLLDLKMPRKNGFEVIAWVRQQPSLRTLPIVVLTSSDEVSDVTRAYELGANSFLVKPADFSTFVEMSQALKGYWLWLSNPPSTEVESPPEQPNAGPNPVGPGNPLSTFQKPPPP